MLENHVLKKVGFNDYTGIMEFKICDNEVMPDGSKFSIPVLEDIAKQAYGKRGELQIQGFCIGARIYEVQVVTDNTRKTIDGEDYVYVKARAFFLEKPDSIFAKYLLDGEIDVKYGCSSTESKCSICGHPIHSQYCNHQAVAYRISLSVRAFATASSSHLGIRSQVAYPKLNHI